MKVMMPEHEPVGRRDTASRVISADPAKVWRAFADSSALMKWLPPGRMTGRALEYDFRPGGRYRIELTYDDADGPNVGKTTGRMDVTLGRFLVLDSERRLVQSVEFDSKDVSFSGEMVMTWLLEPMANGTQVTVIADNVPPGISKADHDAGLRGSLQNLATFVE